MPEYVVAHPHKSFNIITCPKMRAYITGLFDGRIRFTIWKNKNDAGNSTWRCAATFNTTDPRIIDFLNTLFRSTPSNWRKVKKFGVSMYCTWRATGLLLDHIVEIMLPYSQFDQEILEIIKEFRCLVREIKIIDRKVPPEIAAQRERVYERFLMTQKKYTMPIPEST